MKVNDIKADVAVTSINVEMQGDNVPEGHYPHDYWLIS